MMFLPPSGLAPEIPSKIFPGQNPFQARKALQQPNAQKYAERDHAPDRAALLAFVSAEKSFGH
jgi:hypothetical protein